MKHPLISALIVLAMSIGLSAVRGQQPAEKSRLGGSVAVLRNDTASQLAFSYHGTEGWQDSTLAPGKDAKVVGDRVRVITTRADKALITVDYPIEAGKKYRIMWNSQTQIWDFSPVIEQ